MPLPVPVLEEWEEAPWIRRVLAGAKHELQISLSLLRQYPAIYVPYARRARPHTLMTAETEVVIEGYQRSANTFAVIAFRLAQGGDAKIAHHTHAPAQVRSAVRIGVPTLVLLRNPDDAVLEHWLRLRRIASIGLSRLFLHYARFYEPLLPYRSGYVLGAFDEVTSDFGKVISKLNTRFGTHFALFEHTAENVRRCFEEIEENNRRRNAGALVELTVGRPSEERREAVEQLRSLLGSDEVGKHRTRARRVYETLMATDSG